jgi:hypothetical protein
MYYVFHEFYLIVGANSTTDNMNHHFEKYLQKTRERMAMSLMRMLRLGPEVSLSGSPIVSPMTAALWIYEPFLTTFPSSSFISPASMYFLALSHAPPVLDEEMAI